MKNIITDSDYMVTICGYEGIDAIFGPFKKEIAYEFFLELRNILPERPKNTKEEEDKHYASCLEESVPDCKYCNDRMAYEVILDSLMDTYGLYSSSTPDQVCIMKGDKKKASKCACEEFPDRPVMKQGWLY